MGRKIDSGLIKKYTSGKYTFSELKKLANWFQDDKYHDNIKLAVHEQWEGYEIPEGLPEKDLTGVFNSLKTKIINKRSLPGIKQRALNIYFRVAAILLLPLLIYSVYSIVGGLNGRQDVMQWVEIVSPYGARTHFNLPDGTKVSLNSGTKLKYNSDFNRERKLKVEGEAYFDVYHDKSSPFVVLTDVLSVKVLGTKFSIASFPDESSIEVVLEEGKVQLAGIGNSFLEILKPDERFIYDKLNQKRNIENVDARHLTSWKDDILMFRAQPLSEVLKELGRWYNVKFEILDPEVTAFRYRATFRNEPLEEILRLISQTAPIEYEIKDRKNNQNNQYEKKVVEIRKKNK
jgi:ferric-dicitrate binding protein FerR (iron transport regulator)